MGDGGLEMVITYENKVVTNKYKLKGEVVHTEKFTLGETMEVMGLLGVKRIVRVDNWYKISNCPDDKTEQNVLPIMFRSNMGAIYINWELLII